MHSHRGKLLLCLLLSLAVSTKAQLVNLSVKDQPIDKVFNLIEQQSGYHFIYTGEMLSKAKPVTANLRNASLNDALRVCFTDQPLQYSFDDTHILVRLKAVAPSPLPAPADRILRGKVVNSSGEPVAGVSVAVKGTNLMTATDLKGEFTLEKVPENATLVISGAEMQRQEIAVGSRSYIEVTVQQQENVLDETVVIAYGTTSRRLNTGSVATVGAKEIERQPVSNVLGALQGRVAGLEITQKGGVPGSGFSIQLRGRSSLTQGSEPLIIIDGVPFAPGNNSINNITTSSSGGFSPFNLINPSDIERIEVLKDADATAIYGSRGANGVILITTKKGQAGRVSLSIGYQSGMSNASRTMDMLNISQYLAMRREAFANDGIIPTPANAPDLLLWDTTKVTDYAKWFTGGNAFTTDADIAISGGTEQMQFLLNAAYHRETGVMSSSQSLQRISGHSNFTHYSRDKGLQISFTTAYSYTPSNLLTRDLSGYVNTIPHVPLLDSTGNLKWSDAGIRYGTVGIQNPLTELQRKYKGEFESFMGNFLVSYRLLEGLAIKSTFGIQSVKVDEHSQLPKSTLDPATFQLGAANFANSSTTSWQWEPQLSYTYGIRKLKVDALAGATFQDRVRKSSTIYAYDYASDMTLQSLAGAGNWLGSNDYSKYRYTAAFLRTNFSLDQTFLVNAVLRRDGSSRFGSSRRFSNFGSVGAAWIFSNNQWFAKYVSFVSFGKIRGSYGLTGNDQIGDYKFRDTWNNTNTYQQQAGLQPTGLFNPQFEWERNRKLEVALELGLAKDRLLVTAAWYRNRSDNQLVNYALPTQTGFSSVQQNFDALIENAGTELTAQANFGSRQFKYQSLLTLTVPTNKLLAFPSIEKTSYANSFVVGEPITVVKSYRYLGVDPVTGIYSFEDYNRDGNFDLNDRYVYINPAAKAYGGWQHTISIKGFECAIYFEYRIQQGRNFLATQSSQLPASQLVNQTKEVLRRWQKPGDIAPIQRFISSSNSPGFKEGYQLLPLSDGIYSDASFARLKNVSISYSLPPKMLKRFHVKACTIYARGQNLVTFTGYKGADPENQSIYIMPPMRTFIAGIRFSL